MEDSNNNIDWPKTFHFRTSFQQSIGTYLYGRKMYESMLCWDTVQAQTPSNYQGDGGPSTLADFAHIWQQADKIVYSRQLQNPLSQKTQVNNKIDINEILQLKDQSTKDITVSVADLAQQFFQLGLIDERCLMIHPIILSQGKPALPQQLKLKLELFLHERPFKSGVVLLQYSVKKE